MVCWVCIYLTAILNIGAYHLVFCGFVDPQVPTTVFRLRVREWWCSLCITIVKVWGTNWMYLIQPLLWKLINSGKSQKPHLVAGVLPVFKRLSCYIHIRYIIAVLTCSLQYVLENDISVFINWNPQQKYIKHRGYFRGRVYFIQHL
jgi:hypothetical protein